MKIHEIKIHNYRSVIDLSIEVRDYVLLVGANNAGKSTIINAIRTFYEDEKWTTDDFPKQNSNDNESWIQLTFTLNESEWKDLAEKYKQDDTNKKLTVKKYFKSSDKNKCKANQSNIYGIINGQEDSELFYGAKNIGGAKLGQILYIPALTMPADQTKTTGPSPLRDMLNFLLKKIITKDENFRQLSSNFEILNQKAKEENGFFSEIIKPLNDSFSSWNIKINLSLNTISAEEISKSLVKLSFIDTSIENEGFTLERYGHGFQRSVIYELIKLASTFKDEKKSEKKDFAPNFTLILFEEPEAFLHPNQQENMAYQLRRMSKEENQQIIITTHSSIFVGKAAEEISQIIRVQRKNGITQAFQPKGNKINEIFESGTDLLEALNRYINDRTKSIDKRNKVKEFLKNNSPTQEEIRNQEEIFRFQLWLDSERAHLFFAEKVLLVEGATERALFNYLLNNQWNDLIENKICIINVLGKYNFHRFMTLLEVYGIQHGVMLDDDKDNDHHEAVNNFISDQMNKYTLKDPFKFPNCLETYLSIPVPKSNEKKPIEIMKAITENKIPVSKISELKKVFCDTLAIENVL